MLHVHVHRYTIIASFPSLARHLGSVNLETTRPGNEASIQFTFVSLHF